MKCWSWSHFTFFPPISLWEPYLTRSAIIQYQQSSLLPHRCTLGLQWSPPLLCSAPLMTALISLTQGLNKTSGKQRAGARWTRTHKHSRSPGCNHYMLFLCLLCFLTLNLTTSLSLTLMRPGKCPFLLVICLPQTTLTSLLQSWLHK